MEMGRRTADCFWKIEICIANDTSSGNSRQDRNFSFGYWRIG
jgi:hypothetical protein